MLWSFYERDGAGPTRIPQSEATRQKIYEHLQHANARAQICLGDALGIVPEAWLPIGPLKGVIGTDAPAVVKEAQQREAILEAALVQNSELNKPGRECRPRERLVATPTRENRLAQTGR